MQGLWKKAGAALGSALMIGATLVGAALATETMDLGNYQDLITTNGELSGMYVVGANAATADVVTAMGMTAYAGNMQVEGAAGAAGEVTLTPTTTEVSGVRRHVEFDRTAYNAYEIQSGSNDRIGPEGYASGDGVVDYLFSYEQKGPIFIGGVEHYWHEEVNIENSNIEAIRDTLSAQAGDRYDEVFLTVTDVGTITYSLVMDDPVPHAELRGERIWFMGKEYTVISGTESRYKIGSTDAEIVLTTTNPTTTVEGVDVTLGGIFSVGTGQYYQAKVTVTHGGTTETKYINSGATETVAGIEIYIKNAVVTTIGTNEGEAQMVVGAGLLDLQDGDYLERGDGVETSWRVTIDDTAGNLSRIDVEESQVYDSLTGNFAALRPGDDIMSPNDLFGLTYNGIRDQYGNEANYRTFEVQKDRRDFRAQSGNQPVNAMRIRSPDGNFIEFNYGGTSRISNEIWALVHDNVSNHFVFRDTSGATTTFENVTNPTFRLTTADSVAINHTTTDPNQTALQLTEPTTVGNTTGVPLIIEWNFDKFEDIGAVDGIYGYYNSDKDSWFARTSNYTTATRDYYTWYGTYVVSSSQSVIRIDFPEGQTFAQYVVGTQHTGEGTPVTAQMGDTVQLDGMSIAVEGAVSGMEGVTLPTTVAKLDTAVDSSDKASYTLVLVGGPTVNTLVNQLQTEGKLEQTIGDPGTEADIASAGAGVVELVNDAWGTGKYAIVVGGSDRAGTSAAGNILANFDDYASTLEGKTYHVV